LRSAGGDGSALGRGGFVGRHSSGYVRPMGGIIAKPENFIAEIGAGRLKAAASGDALGLGNGKVRA
jgi:hypothetical protein